MVLKVCNLRFDACGERIRKREIEYFKVFPKENPQVISKNCNYYDLLIIIIIYEYMTIIYTNDGSAISC